MAKNNTELPIVRFSLATGIAWGLLVLVTGFAALIWETTYGSQLDAVETSSEQQNSRISDFPFFVFFVTCITNMFLYSFLGECTLKT